MVETPNPAVAKGLDTTLEDTPKDRPDDAAGVAGGPNGLLEEVMLLPLGWKVVGFMEDEGGIPKGVAAVAV